VYLGFLERHGYMLTDAENQELHEASAEDVDEAAEAEPGG
jgi:hypothetical protein